MQASIDSTDGDLARAVAASAPGSAEAATELYRRFAPRVRLYGLRHLGDEETARDLVQQVLLLTIEKLRDGLVRDTDRIASFILGVGGSSIGRVDDVPVSRLDGEVLWALPAAIVRQMPSMRLQITLVSAGDTRTELGTYALDHSASPA